MNWSVIRHHINWFTRKQNILNIKHGIRLPLFLFPSFILMSHLSGMPISTFAFSVHLNVMLPSAFITMYSVKVLLCLYFRFNLLGDLSSKYCQTPTKVFSEKTRSWLCFHPITTITITTSPKKGYLQAT